MKKRETLNILLLYFVFIVFTITVKTVDVQAIGPMDSKVGFATVNGFLHELIGEHLFWYKITQLFGICAIFTCVCFGLLGLRQLIERKSIRRIDRDILALGGFYVVVMAFYALFEAVIINYRPIITDEGLEASYPSSHTILIVCVMFTAIMQLKNRIMNETLKLTLVSLCAVIAVLTVVGRLISGVHWFTDIIGGLLLSIALVYSYWMVFKRCAPTGNYNEEE